MQQKDILERYKDMEIIVTLLKAYKVLNYNLIAFFQFIRLNYFCKNITRSKGLIYVYPNVQFKMDATSKIMLGGDLHIGKPLIRGSKYCSRFLMGADSVLEIKNKCDLREGCDIQIYKNGKMMIDDMHSNIDLEVSCGHYIEIHSDVTIGRHVRIKDYNGHNVSCNCYPFSAPIVIEDHVWLCTGCTINPGVIIGTGAVIADNTNVISNIEPKTFNQGNPSIIINKNIEFKI